MPNRHGVTGGSRRTMLGDAFRGEAMMKNPNRLRMHCWIPAFVLCLTVLSCAPELASRVGDRGSQVDELFARWDRPGSPGAAVGVIVDGEVVLARGYGEANIEHGVPITSATVFDLASVAKQFTGMAIATLVELGEPSLDDDIRTHIPELEDFGATVTVRHLVHHTGGVPDWPAAMALSGRRWDGDVIVLEPLGKDHFGKGPWFFPDVSFERDRADRVTSMWVPAIGPNNMRFDRH